MHDIIYRCTWCMKSTRTSNVCEHCGYAHIQNPCQPHTPEWSRRTINTWECKLCCRVINNNDTDAMASQCTGMIQTLPNEKEIMTALNELCKKTNTTSNEWEHAEGVSTGVGVEHWFYNKRTKQEAYVCDDQGFITISVSPDNRK